MWKDFKQFILRGNVVDLAIAVVLGAAFTGVVGSFVSGLLTPLIAAIVGKPTFADLTFTVNHSTFHYGSFVNAVLSFVIVALVLFFFVVKPVAALMKRRGVMPPEEPALTPCPECTTEIPMAARRCPHCTAVITPAA
jgi:large conductance mechanosensitive channel